MAGQSSIRAAEAHVELTLRDNQFTRGIAAAEKKMAAFGRGLARLGGGALGAGLGIAGPLGLAAKSFADYGSMVGEMAERTGLTTDQFQELSYAAKMAGVEVEDLAKAFKAMQTFMAGDGAAAGIASMGLSMKDFEGKDANATFLKMVDAIGKIETPAQRTAAAMQVFGKAGFGLIPLIAGGSDEIKKMGEEFDRLGGKLSGEQVQAADALGDAYDALTISAGGAWRQIGSAVGDVLLPWAEAAKTAAANTSNFIKENRDLSQTVFAVGLGLMAGGAALLGLSALAYGGSAAMAGLSAALGVAATAFGVMTSPLTIAGVGLGVIVSQTIPVRSAFEEMGAGAEAFGEIATTAWDGIKAAFMSGDLEGAMKVATEAASATWSSFTAGLEGVWNDFYLFVRDTLSMIGQAVDGAFNYMLKRANELGQFFDDIGSGISMLANEGLAGVGIRTASDAERERQRIAGNVVGGGEGVAANNAALDANLQRLQDERNANMMRRREERNAANAALDAEAKAARGELGKVAGEAQINATVKQIMDTLDIFGGGTGPSFAELSGGNKASGTFSGEFASRMGAGDDQSEIKKNTAAMAKLMKKAVDIIDNKEGIAWA